MDLWNSPMIGTIFGLGAFLILFIAFAFTLYMTKQKVGTRLLGFERREDNLMSIPLWYRLLIGFWVIGVGVTAIQGSGVIGILIGLAVIFVGIKVIIPFKIKP